MIYLNQLKSVLLHKWYVFLAGRLTKVSLWRLVIHDWSKFTLTELFGYVGNTESEGVISKSKWAKSWLHHLHCNAHHPEYWVLSWRGNSNFYNELGEKLAPFVVVLPMPENYVREMIADMMATSYKITGSWDILIWFNENGPKMHFHTETIILINKVMREIDYSLIGDN